LANNLGEIAQITKKKKKKLDAEQNFDKEGGSF
jgi:hypothetical protein